MKMGGAQNFSEFLQDFEYQLCGGLAWANSAKIIHLNNRLNHSLQAKLVLKNLPDDDYDHCITKVKGVASRLEALPIDPKAGSNVTSYKLRGADQVLAPALLLIEGRTDLKGDTLMTGVN